jgi:hypothetical protein
MQTGGVFEMTVAQRSGFSQYGYDFLLRGDEVHRCPRLFIDSLAGQETPRRAARSTSSASAAN